MNDLVDSLINRPASPYTAAASSSRQQGVRAIATASGSTPPASIPGTPVGGRTSRLSNEGSGAVPRGPSALGQAYDRYVESLTVPFDLAELSYGTGMT